MAIWYIKRMDSQDEISLPKRILLIPSIKQVQNFYIVTLPIKKNKELTIKTQERIGKILSKKIYEKQNQNIVLAKSLKLDTLQSVLYNNDLNILNGTWLFKYLVPQVIQYISDVRGVDIHEMEVAVMVTENSESTMKMLIEVAQNIKMLNIVTDDIDRFKAMEEYLFRNMGIVIRTTNNKKKGLLKSDLIINLDFKEALINSYAIPKNGVIININERITIKSKRFNGINCNSYSINLPNNKRVWFKQNSLIEDFEEKELYESIVYTKKTYDAIKNELNGSKIEYLIGNNGKIREDEYKNLQ